MKDERCIHCSGPYEASVANARLCMDCAFKTYAVGLDEDGAPIHRIEGKGPRLFRPDGSRARIALNERGEA